MIKNPNDIVDRLVTGFSGAAGKHLLGITMYGGAVSHEYRPGKTEVTILVVLDEITTGVLGACAPVQALWVRRGIAPPLYLTPVSIASFAGVFPVEFLDMRNAYRVLCGEDYLAGLQLDRNDLRLQCRRELSGLALHLAMECVRAWGSPRRLAGVLSTSMLRLLPVLKGMLLLYDRKIPSSKAEIVGAVEDVCSLGASVLSEIINRQAAPDAAATELCERFIRIVETLVDRIDRLHEKAGGDRRAPNEGNQP